MYLLPLRRITINDWNLANPRASRPLRYLKSPWQQTVLGLALCKSGKGDFYERVGLFDFTGHDRSRGLFHALTMFDGLPKQTIIIK
jgi:hypothetical protein